MEIEFDCVPPALPGIDILLVHSQKKAKRIIGKMAGEKAVKDWSRLRARDATTSSLQHNVTGEVVYLIWMRPCVEWSAETDVAILSHEATHVALDYLREIGEDEPSEELFSYTVQAVTEYLVGKHFKWKKKRLADS